MECIHTDPFGSESNPIHAMSAAAVPTDEPKMVRARNEEKPTSPSKRHRTHGDVKSDEALLESSPSDDTAAQSQSSNLLADADSWHEDALRLVDRWLSAREAGDIKGAAECCADRLVFRDFKEGVLVKTRSLAECKQDVFSKAAPKPTKIVTGLAATPESTTDACVLAREFDFKFFFMNGRVRQEWRVERQQPGGEPRIVQVDVSGSKA